MSDAEDAETDKIERGTEILRLQAMLDTIEEALHTGLQTWRTTTSRTRFHDAFEALDRLEARLAAAEQALEAIRAHDFYGMRDREFVTNLLDKLAAATPEEP